MKKKRYMKPAMQVVELQHHCQILAGSNSLTTTSTNLTGDDVLDIDEDNPAGTDFWGR